jgi:hypothetical protein
MEVKKLNERRKKERNKKAKKKAGRCHYPLKA